MNHLAATKTHTFDLAALDVLLSRQGLVAALDCDAATGCMRYAVVSRDNFEDKGLVRLTASYALGFPGRGRRIYTLLSLDLRVHDGVASVLSARRLGRLVPAAPLAEALMTLARTLADKKLPDREQLAPFLPSSLLDVIESNLSAADFPDKGTDHEERLPEPFWERPAVLCGSQIDPDALAITLNLAVGEQVQLVDIDPHTGDCRIFYLGITDPSCGGIALTFELRRQALGVEPTVFNVLSLAAGPSGAGGLCPVDSFSCETGADLSDLPALLPELARIVAALQAKQRPDNALIQSFLSMPAQKLWTQAVTEGGRE